MPRRKTTANGSRPQYDLSYVQAWVRATHSRRGDHTGTAVASLSLVLANTALALGLAIILARALGPEGYGIYAFAFSLVTLLALPANAGMPMLITREVARYEFREEWGRIRGLLARTNQAVVILALCIVPVAAGVAWIAFRREELGSMQLLTFFWALPLVPLMALGRLRGAALRGLRRVVQGQLPEHIVRPGLQLVAVGTLWYAGSLTPSRAMGMHVLASGGAFLVGVVMLLRALPRGVWRGPAVHETHSWAASLLPLSLLAGLQLINQQAGVVALGLLATKEEVGIYKASVQGATFVSSALIAVNMVAAPHFARLYEARDLGRLQDVVTANSRLMLAFALPPSLALVGFSGTLLQVVFGAEYGPGRVALAILGVGQLMSASFGPVVYLLNMTGNERQTLRAIGLGACMNILLLAGLVPLFGLNGAAVATAGAMLVWNVLMWHFVRSSLRIQTLPFSIRLRRGQTQPAPSRTSTERRPVRKM